MILVFDTKIYLQFNSIKNLGDFFRHKAVVAGDFSQFDEDTIGNRVSVDQNQFFDEKRISKCQLGVFPGSGDPEKQTDRFHNSLDKFRRFVVDSYFSYVRLIQGVKSGSGFLAWEM